MIKINKLDFLKFTPSIMSLLALCCGVSAIRYGYSGNFVLAVSLILFACFLDGIDGRIARFLNVSSTFGAEMDSLADLVNFGIAPGFVVYCWKMNELDINGIAWFSVMFLGCCMAIRLARFNADLSTKDQNDPLVKYFFKGVPAPATACLILLPMVLTFRFGHGLWADPSIIITNTLIVSLLCGSTIPTPCFKKIKIKDSYKNLFLILVVAFLVLFVADPWVSLSILGVIYLATIPIAIIFYLKFKKNKK